MYSAASETKYDWRSAKRIKIGSAPSTRDVAALMPSAARVPNVGDDELMTVSPSSSSVSSSSASVSSSESMPRRGETLAVGLEGCTAMRSSSVSPCTGSAER